MSALPPVLLIGGRSNALAVARSLAPQGVEVFALNDPDSYVRRSRFATFLPLDYADGYAAAWTGFLTSEASDHLRGAVLLPMVDEAIEVVVDNHSALASKFVLEEGAPDVRRQLLDKLATYERARAGGIPTPWYVETPAELAQIDPRLRYPLILKPRLSHEFRKRYRGKYIRIDRAEDLMPRYDELRENGIAVVLMQLVPGSDELLCSYYTYLDEAGEPLFHFTKRVIRRSPPNMGPATYHITDWIPGARDLGLRFFQHVGLRGLGNVEFKLDVRDGQLKVIECNARFTEGTCLAHASGCDMALLTYNRLVGRELPTMDHYRRGLRLLSPVDDMRSFRELAAEGALDFRQWIGSLAHPQTFPYFSARDPWPTIHSEATRAGGFVYRRVQRLFRRGE